MNEIEKKIASTPITKDCFEMDDYEELFCNFSTDTMWKNTIQNCEWLRQKYNETKDKRYWKELIRLLPNSYKGLTNLHKENEYWQTQFEKADKERAELQKAIAEKNSVIEKMKCCGNCKKYQIYDADKGIKECWYYYAKEKRCSEKYEKWELAE